MIHLKKFNENYKKEITKIEDTLLQFEDSGVLDRYNIYEQDNRYGIQFRLKNHLNSDKMIETMDNMISSLRKKFGDTIYLYAGDIFIDKIIEKNRKYLNKPISIYIDEYLFNKFKGLKSYRAAGSFPDMLWYGQSPTELELIFKYNKRQKILFIYNNNLIKELRDYIPNYEYTLEFIKDYVVKQIHLEVNVVDEAEAILGDFVPNHLIKLGPTEEYGLPHNGLMPKIFLK